MPYNTRRKSISLPSLGIHVPVSHSQKSISTLTPAATLPALRVRRAAPSDSEDEPEYKRIKTSHHRSVVTYGRTPPLSPSLGKPSHSLRTTTTSAPWCDIDDDVVRAAIEQLYLTDNRPLFIKELANLLSSKLPVIQHSANPAVIVASRLSAFIKRSSWTPKSPCPIGKELESVHPRRTYFFLTTCPCHPLPQPRSTSSCSHSNVRLHSLLSPEDSSDASAASDEAEQYDSDGDLSDNSSVYRERSLSPEVDLSAPELDSSDDVDDVDTDTQSPTWLKYRRGRGPPPPLELDEHEFTQTATGLQKRNPDVSYLAPFSETSESESELAFIDDLPKYDIWANESRASGVINSVPSSCASNLKESSSPHKKDPESDYWLALGPSVASWDRIPETIDLDELDTLLENC